eukprot:TRINITY_DN1800_c0_g3_i1.p1 TRINITY_DN1800_c0_g3~~TRINITY_DN1800_c0_g3_i1.p1  ORF type:complete len:501 (-),score=57.17 TRINITY_DN1800_c0_g3_i1:241-1743(-)
MAETNPLSKSSVTISSPSSQCLSRAITDGVLRHIAGRDAKQRQKPRRLPKKRQKKTTMQAEVVATATATATEDAVEQMKCIKYRIHPTATQAATLLLWMDATKFVYNRAVEHLNVFTEEERAKIGDGVRPQKETIAMMRDWGGIEAKRWDDATKTPERFKGVPYEIRDSPLRDIEAACKALRAKEKTMCRTLRFRRRKDDRVSVTLRARQLNCKTGGGAVWPVLFGTTSGRDAMRTEKRKKLPHVFASDCRLLYERKTKFYYLCVPLAVRPAVATAHRRTAPATECHAPAISGLPALHPDTQGDEARLPENRGGVVAIDPGIRTFGTCYNPDGAVTEWACGTTHLALLYRINRKAGRIERHAKTESGRRRRRQRAVAARLRKRSTDLVDELHHKFARWLCASHAVVLLPRFDTRSIVARRGRGGRRRSVGKKTAGSAMRLSHFRFRTYLINKAREFGTHVEICDEQYTSMTCGCCGVLNRSHNAARNILIRYLTVNNIRV